MRSTYNYPIIFFYFILDFIQCMFSDNNDLGSEGAVCIRNLVQENRSIKQLSLRGNGFIDSDCVDLFEGIKGSLSLEFLDLSENKFCETEWLGKLIG